MRVERGLENQRRLRARRLSSATTLRRGSTSDTSLRQLLGDAHQPLAPFHFLPDLFRRDACRDPEHRRGCRRRSALSRTTASRLPCIASITTSTASSASFLAILERPERSRRAVREVDGSAWRAAITASWRRSTNQTCADHNASRSISC